MVYHYIAQTNINRMLLRNFKFLHTCVRTKQITKQQSLLEFCSRPQNCLSLRGRLIFVDLCGCSAKSSVEAANNHHCNSYSLLKMSSAFICLLLTTTEHPDIVIIMPVVARSS